MVSQMVHSVIDALCYVSVFAAVLTALAKPVPAQMSNERARHHVVLGEFDPGNVGNPRDTERNGGGTR